MRAALVLPWRLARRELRGGLRGFRIFTACLALGVAAIAAVGSLSAAVQTGLREDARQILGGDAEVRSVHLPIGADVRAALDASGAVSGTVEMRAMASADGQGADNARRLLVELKAVDDLYPLYGSIDTTPAGSVPAALAHKDGLGGALVDADVLRRLVLKVGDKLDIGDATFRIAGVIDREPDRGTRVFIFGPRVMIAARDLKSTGLVQLGSLINYYYRVRLDPGTNAARWESDLKARFPDAPWQVRGLSGAAPGMQRFVDRITLYLTLVGLTALLVGGVGVANSVKSYLDGRTRTIATLKCLGAPAALIFRTYLAQIAILAAFGIAIGLVVGAAAPYALVKLVEAQLPVPARLGVYPGPLLLAAAYGVLTALAFSLWPLARARDVAPAALFRDLVAPTRRMPPWGYQLATAVLLAALAGLAWVTAPDRRLAAWFVLAAAGSFVAFRLAAWLIAHAAALINRPGRAGALGPRLRLALANLHRPGAPTGSVVLSLGLGLTVLVAIALIQANLERQVEEQLPSVAPTYFFIDIQSNELAIFNAALKSVPGVEDIQEMPSLRARIVRINDVPVDQARVAKSAAWAVDSDRGLTYAAAPPPGSHIVAGQWWPKDYKGPPLISFDAGLAAGMGVGIGDTLTFNVLGRDIEARIGNLRTIDWTTLGMNFTVIFAPGTLEAAPHTFIATVRAAPGQEAAVLDAVTGRLPNVSAVRVKDALDAVNQILGNIGLAVNATAVVTLLAGTLVLAGAIAAGHRRRVYDAVVLKVLGATRRDVLRAYLVEYGCLGLATAAIAAVLGTGVAWFVIARIMGAPWVFFPQNVALTALLCLAITVAFGFAGTWRALGQKAATLLRNE
ncbi:MAG TPA: FtsX-like permease family protein [Alphaproteobacteria bacterium]|nr:FtsX-like permease family protein [Alphaproteobacteria bacterium]